MNRNQRIRWPFLLVLALAIAGMGIHVVLAREGVRNMTIPGAVQGVKAPLPPIDRMVPKRIETATFALG